MRLFTKGLNMRPLDGKTKLFCRFYTLIDCLLEFKTFVSNLKYKDDEASAVKSL